MLIFEAGDERPPWKSLSEENGNGIKKLVLSEKTPFSPVYVTAVDVPSSINGSTTKVRQISLLNEVNCEPLTLSASATAITKRMFCDLMLHMY